ncbi:DUF7344 domain-containing protein [Halorussus marinus]|uniref:DUF7344 domain-containing protein n=1 Tax=Halorussus marinus TaxID=2505976 RepID=UPI00106E33A0|nr:ArsR family transcriptional regulator [Halorussus marinus]
MEPEGSTDADEAANEPAVSVDAGFDAIADARRRYALYYLRERESATLDELATVVTGWLAARNDPDGAGSRADRDRTRIDLHHVQLPTLASAGVISYDDQTGGVELESLPAFLDGVLDQSLADERAAAERERRESTDERG